ncbi:nERD domain protein [Clostridium sp. CAG:510]|nr:nERD domain protein [Clostridium sp. CAG:510]
MDYAMYSRVIIGVCIVVGILLVLLLGRGTRQKDRHVSTGRTGSPAFEKWKKQISTNCSSQNLKDFQLFLTQYGGGYVKRRDGRVIYRDFLGREKGDLKGIFFHSVIPSRKISTEEKEAFRRYLCQIGVQGIGERPEYEKFDGKLRNKEEDLDEWEKKEAGNKGELLVRQYLKSLNEREYFVISGVVLKYQGKTRELDHIIVGNDVVFILETKAFGMSGSENGSNKAVLTIHNDNWVLHKNGHDKTLKSPTEQVTQEAALMKEIIENPFIDIKPVVVLANPSLVLEKKETLPYEVTKLKDLAAYIQANNKQMTSEDMQDAIRRIDKSRIK